MSPIHAYLTFDGNASEAMRFYEKTLGGTMQMMMTMGEAPTDPELRSPGAPSGTAIPSARFASDERISTLDRH